MPFDRLPHVTPAAHKAFEHAFERTLALGSGPFEDMWDLHLEAQSDPEWAETDAGRKAKVYSVTAAGRKVLAEQRESWARFVGALDAILKVT